MAESHVTEPVNGNAGTGVSLQAILECVVLPVWVVDHDGLVVLAIPAALDTLGFELSELHRIGIEDDHVIVDVRDDGVGGASASAGGSGLAGRADRVARSTAS